MPSNFSAQFADVAFGCAAARNAATSRTPVSPSTSRPRPASRSAESTSSSVSAPTARCSRVRSSTSSTRTSGTSSAPPTTSTIMLSPRDPGPRAGARREPASGGGHGGPSSNMPGEAGEVGVPLLQERVPTLDGLLGHVRQPCRLPGEQLLADQSVVDQVERVLQHPLGGRALGDDPPSPVQRGGLQLGVRDDPVDHAHPVGVLGGVLLAEEEDLAGELLTDLAGQIGRAEAAVEAAHVGVGLLEPGVLGAGQRQVGDDVQAVPPSGGPARDDADDHLGHEPDQPLHLQDVQPAAGVLTVLVPVPAPHPLITAGAERPAAVLRAGAVAGEQHAADVGGQPGVLEDGQQLVDGLRTERVAHLGPVEGDPHDTGVDGPVVGQVGEPLEALDLLPRAGVEDLRDVGARTHGPNLTATQRRRRPAPPTLVLCCLPGSRARACGNWSDGGVELRVGTLNLASGRDADGRPLDVARLRAALTEVGADVLAVQEVDVGQPRSYRVDQPAEVAAALGAADWRFAATVAGTPDPFRSWTPADPPVLRGPGDGDGAARPHYGVALVSRLPVRPWSVCALR